MKNTIKNTIKGEIPIFFSCDDNYIPFLAVTLESLEKNASKNYKYVIKVLHSNTINKENQQRILGEYSVGNFNIEFVDISNYVEKISERLHTRDYYSKSTYYRLFIPNLYPQYSKALYLDSDIVVLGDISKLFNTELGENYVGAITDEVVQSVKEFREYVENRIGVAKSNQYFNAGILLMNLRRLREINFEEIFIRMLSCITFTVAQDQDYLNAICRGHVTYISCTWNKMPVPNDSITLKDINLIHYNLDMKPWKADNVMFEDVFWNYAKSSGYYEVILNIKQNVDKATQTKAAEQTVNLINLAKSQADEIKENERIFKLIEMICNPDFDDGEEGFNPFGSLIGDAVFA